MRVRNKETRQPPIAHREIIGPGPGSIKARITALEHLAALSRACRCEPCFSIALEAERRVELLKRWLP